jgi:thiol-disulfide isomerase/thioredoxin
MQKRTLIALLAFSSLTSLAWGAEKTSPNSHAPVKAGAVSPTAALPLLAVGTTAPDFTLSTSDDDKPISLSDFKGHPVLIDFWASWCPPCKKSLPQTQALAMEFARKGLTVLAVNTWDTRNDMATFLKAHPEYTMTVLFDDHTGTPGHREGSISHDRYHVTGIPTAYLIDKDGKIAATFHGYSDDTDKDIRAAIAKLGIK